MCQMCEEYERELARMGLATKPARPDDKRPAVARDTRRSDTPRQP